ncbi:MAG: hypothetical protein LBU04_05855, partial [Christensenellaceae bacterium]|nr:hypothetical protein [Christensenellaceae bacterium]
SDILGFYRAKDAIEKLFDQIKIDMQGRRIRTHNEQTTDGKMFVTFIALVIRSHMLKKLEICLNENSTSLKKAINKLKNITVDINSNEFRLIKALTKLQKSILACFDAVCELETPIRSCLP